MNPQRRGGCRAPSCSRPTAAPRWTNASAPRSLSSSGRGSQGSDRTGIPASITSGGSPLAQSNSRSSPSCRPVRMRSPPDPINAAAVTSRRASPDGPEPGRRQSACPGCDRRRTLGFSHSRRARRWLRFSARPAGASVVPREARATKTERTRRWAPRCRCSGGEWHPACSSRRSRGGRGRGGGGNRDGGGGVPGLECMCVAPPRTRPGRGTREKTNRRRGVDAWIGSGAMSFGRRRSGELLDSDASLISHGRKLGTPFAAIGRVLLADLGVDVVRLPDGRRRRAVTANLLGGSPSRACPRRPEAEA